MKAFVVNLSLSPQKLERFYAGHVNQVWARDVNGVSLRFPLHALRPHVTHSGVQGWFRIRVSSDHRLAGIERLNPD